MEDYTPASGVIITEYKLKAKRATIAAMTTSLSATVWYKPTCGTCQKVRKALEDKGYSLTLVEYLKTPPTVAEIDAACQKAGIEPSALARQKEEIYPEVSARCKTRQDWLQALHDNPLLIERPVVILEDRAIIARPPERLNEFLSH